MKKDRRWLKSAIAAAAECQTVMPYQRLAKLKARAEKANPAPRMAVAAR